MIHTETIPMTNSGSLEQLLSGGRLSVADALSIAMRIAEDLRRLHDSGQVHGALTTATILVGQEGVELSPAGDAGAITPYTAPELLEGRSPDSRSDIFSFGAILFQLLTGRPAFEGESPVTLGANLTTAPTPASGSPAADRLIGPCLAKNPDVRTPRMQKVQMELKLLSAAVRRADAAARVKRDPAADAATVRAQMEALERRIAERLSAHEENVFHMQRAAAEAVGAVKEQLSVLTAELAVAQDRLSARAEELDRDASERILARVDRGFEAAGEHLARIEQSVDEMRRHNSEFEHSVAGDLTVIEQTMKTHSSAIESARSAMAQTDDLVERVVEALESLQTAVLDQSDAAHERAMSAVN